MVIQRWQTVLLFLALVLVSIFSVSNYATLIQPDNMEMTVSASANTGYWLYNVAIILILLISIFQFKTPKLQKTFVLIAAAMIGGTAIWGYNYLQRLGIGSVDVHLNVSWILLIIAFGFTVISFFLICKDQRLLKSYDRIR